MSMLYGAEKAEGKQGGGVCGRWYLYGDGPVAELNWSDSQLCWLVG